MRGKEEREIAMIGALTRPAVPRISRSPVLLAYGLIH
jgi:hypothetical protein